MPTIEQALQQDRPTSVVELAMPMRDRYYRSPCDWRDEILYFLLPDRFSDGNEASRPLLDRANIQSARAAASAGGAWSWQKWFESGASRWQGGNLRGIIANLDYLSRLGITAIWIGPVFKQRINRVPAYHGYGIQDFLEVDPHFGTRADLVELVERAHGFGVRVILDIIFNHSGANWVYPDWQWEPPYRRDRYDFGHWLDENGQLTDDPTGPDDAVYPLELRRPDAYTRAGRGDLGSGDVFSADAPHKRSDFPDSLRDFDLDAPGVLETLIACYQYWIALTDCDGYRIDTLKHVSGEHARNFCGAIKEFAAGLGKADFFLVGEIAGGDYYQDWYLDLLRSNINAALDIGDSRPRLARVAKGLAPAAEYLDIFRWDDQMGSHRMIGKHHVSVLDDHDHVVGPKLRFACGAPSEHQTFAAVAIQMLTLGIPCIYYGTEQGFAGPEDSERTWLEGWGGSDVYLREAMFGPRHPKRHGRQGIVAGDDGHDPTLPGFGPFGTAGHHCFDPEHPIYRRISTLASTRERHPVLRHGRQYARQISIFGGPFIDSREGEIMAWSRILDDREALCIVNTHGTDARGADVIVDSSLSTGGMIVVYNSAQNAGIETHAHRVGDRVTVRRDDRGAFVSIRDVGPSEALVIVNA